MDMAKIAAARYSADETLAARIAAIDWNALAARLDADGYALTPQILSREECAGLAARYDDEQGFRSRVIMQRHAYGRGEYKYFAYKLPDAVQELRASLYEQLAPIANRWETALKGKRQFPATLDGYLRQCHAAGQKRPTPLLLRYGTGDYNCLHRDLYGEMVFPLQATFLLSDPARDFAGGEFVLVEQRPRAQSRAEVVRLDQGQAVIFPVHHRPMQGSRGLYRAAMRHGVSTIRSGHRRTLGIIFHDAA